MNPKIEPEDANIFTPKMFLNHIQEMRSLHHDMSLIESIVQVIDERKLDLKSINNLIDPILKEKIREEAIKTRMIKGSTPQPSLFENLL